MPKKRSLPAVLPVITEKNSISFKNGENSEESNDDAKSEFHAVFIKEEVSPSCSTEVKKELMDDPPFELNGPIKTEQPSLDSSETLNVSLIKKEKVFVEEGEEFHPTSLENEVEDPDITSGTNGISTTSKGLRDGCSSPELNVIQQKEKPYSCQICGKSFSQPSSLKTHKFRNCSKELFLSNELSRPNQVDTKKRPHKCNICGKAFRSSNYLKIHSRAHTGEELHACDICGQAFSLLSNLKTHYMIHTGEKPHKCNACGKAFIRLSDLKSHNRLHTGEKPYECDICKQTFSFSSALRTHYRIHTGEKPYKCSICTAAFTQSGTLQNHMKIHSAEETLICKICGTAFSTLSNLKKHNSWIHSSGMPNKCNICGKALPYRCICGKVSPHVSAMSKSDANSSGLKTHNKTHIGQRIIKCNKCGKTFSRASQLMFHNMTHID